MCAIGTSFQAYFGGEMMYEMMKRKPQPMLFLAQVIFNLAHHIDMVCEELAFGDAVNYTWQGNGFQHS